MCRRTATEWRGTAGLVPLHMLLGAGFLALLLAGAAQGAANSANLSQAVRESATQALPAPAAESNGSALTARTLQGGATTAQPPDGRKDLTVFFALGVIVDLLLVTAFVAWAIRQWRHSR